ncbi:MAG: type II secretion system F family protein [Sneathiella sp.]
MINFLILMGSGTLFVVSVLLFFGAIQRRRREQWGDRLITVLEYRPVPNRLFLPTAKNADLLNSLPENESKHDALQRRDKDIIFSHFGMSSGKSSIYFIGARVVIAVIFCFSYKISNGLGFAPVANDFSWYGYLILVGVVGFMVPEYIVSKLSKRRKEKIEKLAPDAIDLLTLTVESGISFDEALQVVSQSMQGYASVLVDELEILAAELVVLPHREAAFANLVDRTGSATFGYLKLAILQGEKFGAPVAGSLRIVAEESRQQNFLDKEEKGAKLPVYLSIPLMLFILPPVVAVSVGPGFIQLMRSF